MELLFWLGVMTTPRWAALTSDVRKRLELDGGERRLPSEVGSDVIGGSRAAFGASRRQMGCLRNSRQILQSEEVVLPHPASRWLAEADATSTKLAQVVLRRSVGVATHEFGKCIPSPVNGKVHVVLFLGSGLCRAVSVFFHSQVEAQCGRATAKLWAHIVFVFLDGVGVLEDA